MTVYNCDMQADIHLSQHQTFPELLIDCGEQQITLHNVTFSQSLARLNQLVSEMMQSNFYKTINIISGAKSKH